MSTVTEIREAISKLNEKDRYLLMTELFATMPEAHENSLEFRAAIDEALADAEAGRVYSIEEAHTLTEQWISDRSQVALGNASCSSRNSISRCSL